MEQLPIIANRFMVVFIVDPESVFWFLGGQFVFALFCWAGLLYRKD